MLMRRERGPGFTLIEVIISITVGALVILLVSSLGVRQSRFAYGLGDLLAASAAVQDAATIVAIDLRGVDPAQGDIPAGEARDTSIQFRSVVSTAVICDTQPGIVVLAPGAAGATAFASTISAPQANDTAWLFTSDTTDRWEPHVIGAVGTTAAGQCASGGPALSGPALTTSRTTIRLTPAPTAPMGVVLRVTRPLRYSLYKSSDGLWYLGQRDWNPSTQKLNSIQPVAGPLLAPGPGGGLSVTYADSVGAIISSGSPNTHAIASALIAFRSQTSAIVQIPGVAVGTNGHRADSALVTIGFRNRR